MNDQRQTIVLAALPFIFENEEQAKLSVQLFAQERGITSPYQIICHRLKPDRIQKGTLVVTDHIGRLVNSFFDLMKYFDAISARKIELLLPDLDLSSGSPDFDKYLTFLRFIGAVPHSIRSIKIREGLHIRKYRGLSNGRVPISPEIVQEVLKEHSMGKSIRNISGTLSYRGLQVSKSKVHQVVAHHKKNESTK